MGAHYRYDDDRRPRSKARAWVLAIAIVVFLLIVAAGAECFILLGSAFSASTQAQTAISSVKNCVKSAQDGNSEDFSQYAQKTSNAAHALSDELSTTPWNIASFVPVIGGGRYDGTYACGCFGEHYRQWSGSAL